MDNLDNLDDIFDVSDLLTTKAICNMPYNIMEAYVRNIINTYFSFEDFPAGFFRDDERMTMFLFDLSRLDFPHVLQRVGLRQY